MNLPTITVIGGDLRLVYLAQILHQKHYLVRTYGLCASLLDRDIPAAKSLHEALAGTSLVIGPVPFTVDGSSLSGSGIPVSLEDLGKELTKGQYLFGGNFTKDWVDNCAIQGVICRDFMKMESVAYANAIATAEGAIKEAIDAIPVTLFGSQSLILGFGRCAKILAYKLALLGSHVTIAARREEALAEAEAYGYASIGLTHCMGLFPDCDLILNTIPECILDTAHLKVVPPFCAIIDLASAPGGVDYEAAKKLGTMARLYPGLPGKTAPLSAARILLQAVEDFGLKPLLSDLSSL